MEGTRNLGAIVTRSRVVQLDDGTNVEVRALDMADWAALEDAAVQQCKRSLIETYTKNVDLIPQAYREKMLQDAFKRAEDIRADNLPSVKVKVTIADVEQEVPIGYAHYWLQSTVRGRLHAAWLSVRKSKPGWSLDDAAEFFAKKGGEKVLDSVADAVGAVSAPTLGNE